MKKLFLVVFFTLFSANSFAHGCKKQPCDIFIRDGKFESGAMQKAEGEDCVFNIEADKKHRLKVCNLDKKTVEFESHDLKIEKFIKGDAHVTLKIKKLKKGKTYEFEEEFGGQHCKFKAI